MIIAEPNGAGKLTLIYVVETLLISKGKNEISACLVA